MIFLFENKPYFLLIENTSIELYAVPACLYYTAIKTRMASFICLMVIFVCDATGAEVLVNNGLRELLSIKSVKVINVRDPKPGAWRLRVDSSSAHTLRITGLSKMDFAAGFDQQKPAHISSTQLRPLEGRIFGELSYITDTNL